MLTQQQWFAPEFRLRQRFERTHQALHEVAHFGPVALADAVDRTAASLPVQDRLACALHCRIETGKTAAEIRRSKRRDFQIARCAPHLAGRQPQACQWMLQKRHQFRRGEIGGHGVDNQIEEAAGNRFAEGAAGGIVDAYAPAFETNGDTACQQPVRRYEGGCALRCLGRFAQDQRNGLGLVLGGRGLEQADAR